MSGGEAEGDDGGGHLLVVFGAGLCVDVEGDGEDWDQGDAELNPAVATRVVDGLPVAADEVDGLDGGPGKEDQEVGDENYPETVAGRD